MRPPAYVLATAAVIAALGFAIPSAQAQLFGGNPLGFSGGLGLPIGGGVVPIGTPLPNVGQLPIPPIPTGSLPVLPTVNFGVGLDPGLVNVPIPNVP